MPVPHVKPPDAILTEKQLLQYDQNLEALKVEVKGEMERRYCGYPVVINLASTSPLGWSRMRTDVAGWLCITGWAIVTEKVYCGQQSITIDKI